jgi:hypothetical protein
MRAKFNIYADLYRRCCYKNITVWRVVENKYSYSYSYSNAFKTYYSCTSVGDGVGHKLLALPLASKRIGKNEKKSRIKIFYVKVNIALLKPGFCKNIVCTLYTAQRYVYVCMISEKP